jgi:hypothetical protein
MRHLKIAQGLAGATALATMLAFAMPAMAQQTTAPGSGCSDGQSGTTCQNNVGSQKNSSDVNGTPAINNGTNGTLNPNGVGSGTTGTSGSGSSGTGGTSGSGGTNGSGGSNGAGGGGTGSSGN